MTTTEQLDSWRSVFEARDIDLAEAESPDDSDAPWFQTVTHFTKRGFLRVTVSPDDDTIAVHAQVALPGGQDDYAKSLKRYLKEVAETDWTLASEERPWVLEVEAMHQEKLEAVVEAFERVAEHISRAEAGEDARELAAEFGGATENDATENDAGEETPAASQQATAGDAGSSSPFESIGDGKSARASDKRERPGRDTSAHDEPTGAATLDRFHVRVEDATIRVRLELANRVDERTEKNLLSALARTLRARYDIKLLGRDLVERDGQASVELAVEPAELGAVGQTSGGQGRLGELANDLGRYFERLKKFNAMGMSLIDVLAPSSGTSQRPARPAASDRGASSPDREGRSKTAADSGEPHLRGRDDQRRAESDETGVVFSFGGAEVDSSTAEAVEGEVLQAGNYTDPRIRRDDATTPLVDVVLRHPGYSDKSMRQVLSILLDIDYFESTKLAEQAPCIIAWGISQERAQEFKRVIERAGGRVTLVEPDSLIS